MKKFIKRALSWLLISGMVLAEPMQVYADNMPETIPINGQELDDVPEDGNYVYLGTASVNVTECDGVFSLPIYRTGDTDKKASVTIRAISLTADYNKDYALVGTKKKTGFTAATLMQLIAGSDASDSDEASDNADNDDTDATGISVRKYEGNISTVTPSQADGDARAVIDNLAQTGSYSIDRQEFLSGLEKYNELKKATDTEYQDEEDEELSGDLSEGLVTTAEDKVAEDDEADSDKSPLARLKEEQTGLPTRETEDTVYSDPDLTDQVLGELMPESVRELPYACEQLISFDKGESETELKFRVYDNSKSDGNRVFSLYIVDTDNVEPYKVTSTSVTIEDDEEVVHPSLSFDREVYDASDNTARIVVKREGLENSMATAVLYAYDISSGEETALGEVAFLPYEKEKEIKLNIDHEVTLELTDLKAAESGEITTAHVTGAKRDLSKGGLSVLEVDDNYDSDDESEIMLLSEEGEEDDTEGTDGENGIAPASNSSEGENGIALASNSVSDSSARFTFNINLNNKDYQVQYDGATIENGKVKSAPVKGTIYDTSYNPALEIGEYYFSTPTSYGGMYDYTLERTGDKPWGCGTLEENYTAQSDAGAWNKAHGNLKYYHTTMWKKGSVYNKIPSGKSVVNTTLYQVLVPDIASTSGFGGGQKTDFVFKGQNGNDINGRRQSGSFARRMQDGIALRIKKGKGQSELDNYDYIYPYAKAVDDDWHTPKSYVEYYGFAALYKTYNVSINNPRTKKFKSFDTTIDALPVQTEVASGADKLYDKSEKMVYVNADEDKSNLVFKLKKNTVNGKDDVFCELKGYTISMGSGKNTCTLNYPEDLRNFINDSARKTTALLDYSPEAKKTELKKLEDIATVALDSYFIDWIDTVQSEKGINVIENGDRRSSQGYYQNLVFTPVIDYIDVKVKVTAPVLDGGTPITDSRVVFWDNDLMEGAELTYHAGDRLNLSMVSKSSRYTVMGYEVSTDGGHSFNTIRNSNELVLLPGSVKGYIIRPCVQANDNCIELSYSGQSQKKVHVDNVIPQSALAAYPELKGRYFLDINPNAKDPYERMRPEPGKCYSIDVIVDDESASTKDKVTRPTVTDRLQDKTYNTNKHYLIAKKNKSDNRYVIGTKETEKSSINSYTLNGQIVMKAATIRSSALGYRNVPMVGYTVFTGGEQQTLKDNKTGKELPYVSLVSSVVPESAKLSLINVRGAVGDRITIAIDNGINDTQVEEVVLGDPISGGNDIGQLVTTYPITAPYFVSVDYEYDNRENSQKVDHRDNTVNCFDDTLTLTASINPNGREIEKVVFLVYTSSGVVAGKYEAMPKVDSDESTSNSVFEVRIDKMLERFNNGDRIYAYIVDKEKKQLSVGTVNNLPIVYPTMDTGLIMCVQNELIKPKDFNLYYEPPTNLDLGLIGKPALGTESGVLSFTKTKNEDNTMYMLTVNMDFYFANKSALTANEKKNKFMELRSHAARINAGRKLAAAEEIEDDEARDAARAAAQAFSEGLAEDQYDHDHPGSRADQVAGREASFVQDKIVTAEVCVTMGWTFVYDAKKNDYVMATFVLTIGGMVQISKTFYWVVSFLPVYVNLTASAQVSVNMTWVKGTIQDAIKEGDFNNTTGNVKELVDTDAEQNLEVILKGKASLGAGVQDCLSIRLYGAVTFDIDYVHIDAVDEANSKGNAGLLIACAVGVGIDLIAVSGDVDLIKGQLGVGTFEGQTEVSFLGGAVEDAEHSKPSGKGDSGSTGSDTKDEEDGDDDDDEDDGDEDDGDDEDEEENAAVLSLADNADLYYQASDEDESSETSVIRFRENGMGTNDFSDFASYDAIGDSDTMLRGIPAIKDKYTLLNPAAEHTRSRIIQLNGSKQFVVFLGASEKESRESTLYYTVGHGQSWTKPQAIEDDGTFDTTPDVLRVDDDRLLIAWANARESVSAAAEDEDFTKKYTSFKISAAFYDIKKGKMGEVFTLQDDAKLDEEHSEQYRFFNLYPKLSMLGEGDDKKIYCTYLKRDVSKAYEEGDESKLLDLKSLYSTMAFVTCDLNGENVSAEQYINISTEYDDEGNQIVDPLVTDYKMQTFTLKELKDVATSTEAGRKAEDDTEFIAAIYTIDTDGDMQTGTDRYIYLDVYDITHKKNYYPVKISSNKQEYVDKDGIYKSSEEVMQSSPQLSKLGGRLYATWIEDGHEFVLVDLTETMQTLLGTDGISELYTGGNHSTELSQNKAQEASAGTYKSLDKSGLSTVTPSEYPSDNTGSINTAAVDAGINNAVLSAETRSLLRVLRNSLTGGGAELNAVSDPRAWNRVLTASGTWSGWLSNSRQWNETVYGDVSDMLQSYYTELYKDAFNETDKHEYTKDEQAKILEAVESEEFLADSYNATIFGKISNDNINRYMIDVSGYDGSSGIGEYKLAYDGTDVYVLYTDTCDNPEHLGTELFGMRFRQSDDADEEQSGSLSQSSDAKVDESGNYIKTDGYTTKSGGFTTPVMITVDDESDDYMDEFDVCFDSARNMYVVANSFKIGTGTDGKIVNGAINDNSLMYYYFEPGGSVTTDLDSVDFAQTIVRNELSEVNFNIENHGLFDAENGYDVAVDIVSSDKKTVIEEGVYKENSTALIKAGEKKFISASWLVPDMDLTGCLLRITTKENGYDDESVSYVSIPVKADIVFEDDDISYDGEKISVTATVTNIGNADCKALMFRLFNYKDYNEDEIQQQYVGTLKSGESKQMKFSLKANSEVFDSLGYINLKLTAMTDDRELDSVYPSIMPNRPVLCEINGGIDKLTLNQGETRQLTAEILPWNPAADDPSYSSSDPTIAYVDENGVVHAVSGGKCIITVYYPGLGISADVELSVKGSNDSRNSHSARNRGSEALAGYGSPIKGAIRGEWQLQDNGRWAFIGNGRRYASEWAYVYNPYASRAQEQYDWFRFDAEGNMLTGWYQDTDGRWYYLWELSNNLLGHMVTGWNYINGKWYYFSTVSGGPLGSMLSAAWTPDGYYVGPDGAWTGGAPYSLLQDRPQN